MSEMPNIYPDQTVDTYRFLRVSSSVLQTQDKLGVVFCYLERLSLLCIGRGELSVDDHRVNVIKINNLIDEFVWPTALLQADLAQEVAEEAYYVMQTRASYFSILSYVFRYLAMQDEAYIDYCHDLYLGIFENSLSGFEIENEIINCVNLIEAVSHRYEQTNGHSSLIDWFGSVVIGEKLPNFSSL